MAKESAKEIVDQYNHALEIKDFAGARRHLAENLHFEGPIDRFDNADDYIAAITRLHGMVKGIEHQATLVDGDEVALFYMLDTPVAKAPVAEWYTVQDQKIVQLRAYFDARPFAGPAPSGS